MWLLKESQKSICYENANLFQTIRSQSKVVSSFIQPFDVAATATPEIGESFFLTFLAALQQRVSISFRLLLQLSIL